MDDQMLSGKSQAKKASNAVQSRNPDVNSPWKSRREVADWLYAELAHQNIEALCD